ncbi:MAG: class I SAM-dependent methyltransferase [Proteobacteria bacterium]|nr:class I SAM-dependent methyltransferase [Pseudomonadota bacterium]
MIGKNTKLGQENQGTAVCVRAVHGNEISDLVSTKLLDDLEVLAAQIGETRVSDFSSPREIYNWVLSTTHELCHRVDALEGRGIEFADIQARIVPAITAQLSSPFMRRMREWPRGYPGDYETIEYLCDGVNHAQAEGMGWHFERYFLANLPVFQHRNKLSAQARRIADACSKRRNANILIVACGGARDLLSVVDEAERANARITFNDIDSDALALCKERFGRLITRFMPGNAFKMMGELALAGPFDLIVCGGLFDYVPEPFLKRAIPSMIDKLLAEDGALFFTNIAEGNPYRTWMEHFGNWKLIERSEEQIRSLISSRNGSNPVIEITRDSTGLTFLVDVKKGVAGQVGTLAVT